MKSRIAVKFNPANKCYFAGLCCGAVFFYKLCTYTDVSKVWVCGWNPKVWNLFSKNCYKVKYFFGAILFAYFITAPMNDAHSDVTNLRIQPFPRRGARRNGCIRRLAKCETKLNLFMCTPERSRQKHMQVPNMNSEKSFKAILDLKKIKNSNSQL